MIVQPIPYELVFHFLFHLFSTFLIKLFYPMIKDACGGPDEKVYGLIPKMTPWTREPSTDQKREYSVKKGQ